MLLIKYAFSELKHQKKFVFFFILNLAFGLVSFITLDGFKASIDKSIGEKSRAILGGDISLSSRRPLTPVELKSTYKYFKQNNYAYEESKSVELYTMGANPQNSKSRLVQIKAVQGNFPFYGKIKTENNSNLRNGVVTYKDINSGLGISINGDLKLGNLTFTVKDIVKEDPSIGISTNMAPRAYIPLKDLDKTGLLGAQSLAWHSSIFKIRKSSQLNQEIAITTLNNIRDDLAKLNPALDLRIKTHQNTSEQMSRLFNYLSDFLSLAALCSIILSFIGCGFLFRSYMGQKSKEIGIYQTLGLSKSHVLIIYLLQLITLGVLASILAFILSLGFLPFLISIVQGLTPYTVELIPSTTTLLYAIIIGVFSSLLPNIPFFQSTFRHNLNDLMMNNISNSSRLTLSQYLSFSPLAAVFYFLCVINTKSWIVGSLFFIGLIAIVLLVSIISLLVISIFKKLSTQCSDTVKQNVFRDIARFKGITTLVLISFSLSLILLSIIPHLEKSLNSDLLKPTSSGNTKLPNLFLFDIQQEQVEQLHELVNKNTGIEIELLSPMIRSRLTKVNGNEFVKGNAYKKNLTREEERELRFRNRGFNLSYRNKLYADEKIVQGEEFDLSSNQEEISLEKRFAARLKLNVGDKLTFNIQGVDLEATISNIRTVKWTNFSPNFFILFKKGMLEHAPKTFLATIRSKSVDQKLSFQDKLVDIAPNISSIDVSQIMKRISDIMQVMSYALKLMSYLCLLSGLIIILTITRYQSSTRAYDIALFKVLGLTIPKITQIFRNQLLILASISLVLGNIISIGVSFLICKYVFDSQFVVNFSTIFISSLTILIGTYLIVSISNKRVISKSTLNFLN